MASVSFGWNSAAGIEDSRVCFPVSQHLKVRVKEPLINSESFSCAEKMSQIKAPIAGKTQSNRCSQSIRFAHGPGPAHGASFSKAIDKIGNAELAILTSRC
jgi:hypothetical protein